MSEIRRTLRKARRGYRLSRDCGASRRSALVGLWLYRWWMR